jgi:hypothetical protein
LPEAFEQLVEQLTNRPEFVGVNPTTGSTHRKLQNKQKRKFSEANT